MSNLSEIDSQDPVLENFREDVLESGHEETLDNEKRGCGHLDNNAAYVRADVNHPAFAGSGGEIPRFVALDEPVEYREYGDRGAIIPGWKPFPGAEFATAYVNEGHTTTPSNAIQDHHDRLAGRLSFDGKHYGEITAARSHDLLMSVGATHWQTPEEYIDECRRLGLNLKVPASPNREPPVINPMRTRCWVVHPNGGRTTSDGESRAAVIGYAVLSRTIFTTGEDASEDDPDVPEYAREWAEVGRVNLATPGEEVDPETPDAALDDFEEESDA